MRLLLKVGAACLASALLAGAASAADMPRGSYAQAGYSQDSYGAPMVRGHRRGSRMMGHRRHHMSMMGMGHRSSPAGRAKQRHRTRLDRCQNVPSRC